VKVFISAQLPDELLKVLESAKVDTVHMSLIKTLPVSFDPQEVLRFNPDCVLISSKNGARHFFSRVRPEEFKDKEFIAVGKATASYLESVGLSNVLVPENYSGEGIVELLNLKNVAGKRFLLVRPRVSRKVVPEFLKSAGARVMEVVVYETVVDTAKRERLLRAIEERPSILSFTSPSNFSAFMELGGERAKEVLNTSKLLPIGHVTAKAIRKHGFAVWKVPKEYTLEGIVKTITEEV
jgi:uroporphyrinogen-III synthase